MKHLLLSLLLLTPNSLFPANGAASATPAAGAAAGGVAGASVEADAKRGETDAKRSDADLKSIQDLVERGHTMYAELIQQVVCAASPLPLWEDTAKAITDVLDVGESIFHRDVAHIIAEYIPRTTGSILYVVRRLLTQERCGGWERQFQQWSADFESNPENKRQLAEYKKLLREHGVVFPHDKRVLEEWNKLNFTHTPLANNDWMADRVCCASCPESKFFGQVSGLGFEWRMPLYNHHVRCRWLRDDSNERVRHHYMRIDYGHHLSPYDPVPFPEKKSPEFAYYVMRHLDFYARTKCQPDPQIDANNVMKMWLVYIENLHYCMFYIPKFLEYAQDPEGWKERENKRAEELGSAVRYPVQKDQPK